MGNANIVELASKACEVKDLLLDLASVSVSAATKKTILGGLVVRLEELTEGVADIALGSDGKTPRPGGKGVKK